MAMMPSAVNPAEQRPLYDNDAIEQDIIDPDDGKDNYCFKFYVGIS